MYNLLFFSFQNQKLEKLLQILLKIVVIFLFYDIINTGVSRTPEWRNMNNFNNNNGYYVNNQPNQMNNNGVANNQFVNPIQPQQTHTNTQQSFNNIGVANNNGYFNQNYQQQNYQQKPFNNQQQNYQSNIQNFTLSRLLIKKVYKNKEKNNTSLLIQLSRNEGFFIDSKFVKVDNYTLDFTIGIIPTHNYSVIVIGNKNIPPKTVTGVQMIELIKNNINTDII